jgi:hypothetical protein
MLGLPVKRRRALLSNYTVEADVRVIERRRQMGDVGVTNQTYSLVLFGNRQRLEMWSWQENTQRVLSQCEQPDREMAGRNSSQTMGSWCAPSVTPLSSLARARPKREPVLRPNLSCILPTRGCQGDVPKRGPYHSA